MTRPATERNAMHMKNGQMDSLPEQIAASIEDVKQLLADNRSLSIAFLSRRIRDLEEDVRRRFREIHCPCVSLGAVEQSVTKLEQRMQQAAIKFREMQEELDKLKQGKPSEGQK